MRRLLLAVAVLLALPAPAPAADKGLPSGPVPRNGVALVEDGAVWVRPPGPAARLGEFTLMGGRPDGTVRALLRSGGTPFDLSSDGSLATFATWRGVWTGTAGGMRQVYAGAPGCYPGAADVDGDVMAVALFCADGSPYRVVVRGPGDAERTFPAAGFDVEVAGRYVAWNDPGGPTLLYDAAADRQVLREGRIGGRVVRPIGLQPDGKLLVAFDPSDVFDTAWISPDQPTLHRLGIQPRTVFGFANDRILRLTSGSRPWFDPEEEGPLVPTRATLVDLDGSRRLVASTRGGPQIGAAHYDGQRVALAQTTCDGTRILLRSAAEPPLTAVGDGLCPLELRGPVTFSFGSGGSRGLPRLRVPLRCDGGTLRRCGYLTIRTPDGQELSHVIRFSVDDRSYSVTLREAGLRRIATDGSMRVRVEMVESRGGPLLQRPATALLRVTAQDLARLRSCVRLRRQPARTGCGGLSSPRP